LKLKIKSAEDLLQAISDGGFDTVDILVKEDNKYKARTIVLLGRDGLSLRAFYLTPSDEPTIHEFSIIWPSSTELRLSEESQRLTKIRIGILSCFLNVSHAVIVVRRTANVRSSLKAACHAA
jgi:hypothetical protein